MRDPHGKSLRERTLSGYGLSDNDSRTEEILGNRVCQGHSAIRIQGHHPHRSFLHDSLRAPRCSDQFASSPAHPIHHTIESSEHCPKLVASFIDGLTAWALSRGRKEGEYPILVIMDEFRDNPYIPNFISGMTAGAGLGITFYPIVQTLGQLKERYRDSWENIRNNVEYLILFENPDPETQRLVSEIVGEYTTSAKTESKSKGGWSKGYSESERRKRLINPSEIGVIPFGHHIVLARRHQMRPILCKSAFWDQLKEFRRLVPRKARIKT